MRPFAVALVSDLLEENWPSMDLVSDMLYAHVRDGYPAECTAAQLRPPMRLRFFRNADRVINRFFDYPRWLRQRAKEFDVFHILDQSYSQLVHVLPPRRTVVTCHDLDAFRCLLAPDKEKRSLPFRLMTGRILSGLRKASRVLCVSQTVCDELASYFLIPPERLSVILNGVDRCFSPAPDPEADAAAERLLPFGKDVFLILHVGSAAPRKRIDVLLKIARRLPGCRLIKAGCPIPEQDGLSLPFLDRRTLAAVYRRADLLLVPSEAEGFGLPLIEALACGCPVAASDIRVLREVGGHAAEFCPVADVTAWVQTITRLMAEHRENPAAWEQRRRRGVARAAAFTWQRSAAKYLDIYKTVLEKP